jgi:hypothetical protein
MTRPPGRRGGGGRSPGRTGGRTRKVKSGRDSTTGCGVILFALVASPTLGAVVWMVTR